MNIYRKIENEIRHLVEQLKQVGDLPADVVTDKVEATPTKDAAHGDIATNAAMVVAAQVGRNPKEIAALILELLKHQSLIAKAEIAGPGFINITLNDGVWQKSVLDILNNGRDYGRSTIGKDVRVNVEYVSANPTGPMHVGHGRGAVYGDALGTLLQKAGYDVTREYYINDAGGQIDKLADSAYLRYRQACGETVTEIPEGLYPGDYLIPVGKALADKYGTEFMNAQPDDYRPVIRLFTVNAMMELIKQDLAALGIHHDIFTSERAITEAGKVGEAMATLEAKGLIYTGVLEPPKGKTPDDWEPRPQTLFRATQFGDDSDRPVKKSDGSWTYFAPDIAYHFDKCNRNFNLLIDVFGADHGGYVKRLKAAVNALSGGTVTLDVKLMQMIKLMRGGEPAKMSKRAGNFVMVSDVVDEVGKDVFRFIMLNRKNDAPLDFDFEKVMEQSKDNPVFYVQYAHARSRSVIRNIKAEMPDAAQQAVTPSFEVLHRLSHPQELALIRVLCGWPRLVEQAALAREPHRVTFYLQELAAAFHGFWNLGNDDLGLRFIIKHDIELTAARMALADAVSQVIASGLNVLGVEPLEEMR